MKVVVILYTTPKIDDDFSSSFVVLFDAAVWLQLQHFTVHMSGSDSAVLVVYIPAVGGE